MSRQKITIEKLKILFKRYKKENGKYPNSLEVDACDYLPSSKTIQRNFGGVVNFKRHIKSNGPDERSGQVRKKEAIRINKESEAAELEALHFLYTKYQESEVHIQSPYFIGDTKIRADFLLYKNNKKLFYIDIFKAKNIQSLKSILNIKSKKILKEPACKVFFVLWQDDIDQNVIDKALKNKKEKMRDFIKVLNKESFKSFIDKL